MNREEKKMRIDAAYDAGDKDEVRRLVLDGVTGEETKRITMMLEITDAIDKNFGPRISASDTADIMQGISHVLAGVIATATKGNETAIMDIADFIKSRLIDETISVQQRKELDKRSTGHA